MLKRHFFKRLRKTRSFSIAVLVDGEQIGPFCVEPVKKCLEKKGETIMQIKVFGSENNFTSSGWKVTIVFQQTKI